MKNKQARSLLDCLAYEKLLALKGEGFWLKKGERSALQLFHDMARRVPAYKRFLKEHGVLCARIKTVKDMSSIPIMTKKNYLKKYPLEDMCWDGKLSALSLSIMSVSSGSTGEPTYWPRGHKQDGETSLSHELFMRDSFEIHKRSTLFINSFAMGVWIAGILTYRVVDEFAKKYRLTQIAPGINKDEIISIIKRIGKKYDQIIIAGYPPFVKDVIDDGPRNGINWRKFNIKFLFAAESFSESWRDYMYKKVGAQNPHKNSLNIYGTADACILAHETPLSILIRRIAFKNPAFYERIFIDTKRVPTLAQYNPALRFFEEINGALFVSARSGVPLFRYDVGDSGGIIRFSEMEKLLNEYGIDIQREAKKYGILISQLPFVSVFGRSDFTAFLYGVNIYPENIRDALGHTDISHIVSGKFTMLTGYDRKKNQYLEINIELQNTKLFSSNAVKTMIEERITRTLKEKNSEYRKLSEVIGACARPRINLYPHGYPEFFRPGIKQKWYRKNT